MPTKKKPDGRKRDSKRDNNRDNNRDSNRDNDADLAELESLRKQVAEQHRALKAEEARKEEESQSRRQVTSRRQRTLVRWDVDTDIRLLLAIQYACNKLGVKIPWKDVAEAMGEKFTEGAIVQHLSKLRAKRDEQDKPNPPPLKRAGNGYHKSDTSNKKDALPSPKEESGPNTRSTKKRRRDPSDDESEDSVYTLKKKQFTKNKKKDKVFVAPKLRTKREDTDSNDSQKLVCVGAEWLRDFTGGDERGVDREVDGQSESSEADSTESSQATTQAAKKSKMVTLKVGSEGLASVDRSLENSATFRDSVTPTNPPRVITNMPPRHSSYFPYMRSDSMAPFSPLPPPPFSTRSVSIPFPSNGPSPFDIANRTPDALLGTTSSDGLNPAYSPFDIPAELQLPDHYGYPETSSFDNQFIPDNEMFVGLSDVEPPRYLGYDGEDVKEF
ncbi:hypothetical protein N7517_006327 [Penicillium concentricum]|uniref:Myb-like domain-containing protein n=1 Tax=Penicillium concentricum TaxID=293559 RepID=A0A9W9VCE9_9EURO|nr:uncharacterized protein N7517_006327 [Penicillium concentricum]KAJ5374321.1 hypothetical protein N7517_006327 [Penicillium concentricum]